MKDNMMKILSLQGDRVHLTHKQRKIFLKQVGQKLTQSEWDFYSALKYRYINGNDWFLIQGKHLDKDMTADEKHKVREWFIHQQEGYEVDREAIKRLT